MEHGQVHDGDRMRGWPGRTAVLDSGRGLPGYQEEESRSCEGPLGLHHQQGSAPLLGPLLFSWSSFQEVRYPWVNPLTPQVNHPMFPGAE